MNKPRKMKAYASFADWKKDQSAKHRKLICQIERLVEDVAPHFTTSVKWGQGCWVDGATPKLYVHAEDDHLQFGFFNGSSLEDPHDRLVGSGKYVRHIKVRSTRDLDDPTVLPLVRQVVATDRNAARERSKRNHRVATVKP